MNQLELFPTSESNQETNAPSRAGSPLYTANTANQDSKSRNQKSGHASVFDQFTDDQLLQIVDWLADHTYNQTRGLIKDNYHREISHGAIQRFFERTSFLEHLDQSEQAAVAAREILRNTVSNQVNYSEATLRLLEQTAFNLALTSRTRPRDLDPLNRINNIICRSRNTAVRERHATVQEKKTDLRTRELDLKTQIFQARLDGRLTPVRKSNSRWGDHDSRSEQSLEGNKFVAGLGSQHAAEPTSFSDAATVQDNSARPKMKILVDEDGETFVRRPGPCPLPDDVVIKNHAYAKKLLAGLVDPVTGEELPAASTPTPNGPLNTDPVITDHSPSSALAQNSGLRTQNFLSPEVIANTNLYDQKIDAGEIRVIYAPGKHYEIEYCNRADQPALERLHKSAPLRFFEDPTRTQWLPALRTFGKNPYIPPTAIPLNTDSITDSPITEHSPSASSAPKSDIKNQKSDHDSRSEHPIECNKSLAGLGSQILETQNSKLNTQNSTAAADLAAAVDRYTVNRIREYIRHNQNHTPWPYRHPAPEFITEERHCPCGHACPCPTHETIPDVGPFPPIFWKKSPFDAAYAECLRDRNLTFRRPDEYLP